MPNRLLLCCGFNPLHAPSGENQVVTRARRKLFGAFKAAPGMTACDESCWHHDLLEVEERPLGG